MNTDKQKDVLEILGVSQEGIRKEKGKQRKEKEEERERVEQDEKIFWKLDPSEDITRRRMKMRRNYKGSRHIESSYEKFIQESNKAWAEKEDLSDLNHTLKAAQQEGTKDSKQNKGKYFFIINYKLS